MIGIELIELGGTMPTSVTTAVIFAGGVRSYNGLRISRFGFGTVVSASRGMTDGKVSCATPGGAIYQDYSIVRNTAIKHEDSNVLTKFVLCERVQHDTFRKLVSFATY